MLVLGSKIAELPRDQRRLLGRHSSSLQDSDSIYARDLAVAPVKALQRVLTLIRDGEFEPDQPRADFFKGTNPLAPGTPAPVFQPWNACLFVKRIQGLSLMLQWNQMVSGSTSRRRRRLSASKLTVHFRHLRLKSCHLPTHRRRHQVAMTSIQTWKNEVEVSDDRRPPNEDRFSLDAMVKNGRTGIIHSVPDIGPDISGSVYANGELLQKKTTKCGRLTSAGFVVVQTVPDWTAKCRVCFKGCREPPKRR